MLKCPICNRTAKIEEESKYGKMFCRKFEQYYIKCGCEAIRLRGKNKIDLEAQWNRWTRMIKKMRE